MLAFNVAWEYGLCLTTGVRQTCLSMRSIFSCLIPKSPCMLNDETFRHSFPKPYTLGAGTEPKPCRQQKDRNPCSLNGTRHGSGRGRQSPAILAVGVFMPLADAYATCLVGREIVLSETREAKDTLGLPRSCSDEEVKQAYRALALKIPNCTQRRST